ncbi:MAG TPA: hypothetical protein VJ739_05355, partial [Gemmataceae bacterium]|nr:hypothetical protein [Gemmataceae bacterium]
MKPLSLPFPCRLSLALAACLCLLLPGAGRGAEDKGDVPAKGGPPELKYLEFRSIGPSAGGRVCRAAGVPGDPLTYYAATAAGGVWKSGDGGLTWKPVFDEQPASSIGSLAIAPSDPNVVYVGTGEANIRGNVQTGNGIYKTVDAGKTWHHVWKQQGQIGTMIVHPTNPDIAYAAVLGHAFGPNPERGVYRTTDGGKTWKKVLGKDENTGASDVCFDPSDPKILFAGLWQARRRPWDLTSGGPGSGLYTSRDGGDTWTQLVAPPDPDVSDPGQAPKGQRYCKGLPAGIWGKIGVAVAPSDGRRVYALIEAEKGGLFRSDDGGETWTLASGSHALRQRAWYYSTLTVDPANADVVWCPQVPMLKSIDGGKTFQVVKGIHHGDNHDLWIDPKDPRRIIGSNDGGVDISTNGGRIWYAPPLPIAQFYHVAADTCVPYHVSGTMQDLGTASGPTNSLSKDGIPLSDWHSVGGGETGFTAPDPADPDIIYAGEYGGYISRYDERTRQARSVGVYPFNPSGHGAGELKYRFQWTAPILISPHDPKVVYHAANVLFRSSDGGRHWTPISPDLTRDDKTKEQWSGGPITGDNTGAEYYCTIFAIAESPREQGVLWAGSDDGLVHVTRDGGKRWEDVTKNIPGMPEWATVDCIEASPHDAGTAYLVVDAHRLDDMRPYLYRTQDYGKTWQKLTGDLPQDVYLHVVREDPKQKGLLYLGTERGLCFSTDDGGHWRELKLNLPTAAVHDLIVKGDDLVVGTSGRSIWIFDDLTPVRALASPHDGKGPYLLAVQPAYRYRYSGWQKEGPRMEYGDNPPVGAAIHYYLPAKPQGQITLEILDGKGQVVQTLTSKEEPKEEHKQTEEEGEEEEEHYKKPRLGNAPGLHRVVWDLRYAGAREIPDAKIDSGDPKAGPLVNPGTYQLRLHVEGTALTGSLVVKLDPRQRLANAAEVLGDIKIPLVKLPAAMLRQAIINKEDLEEELALALHVRDDINRLADLVEQLRTVREQLVTRNKLLAGNPEAAPLVKASKELIDKLNGLEEQVQNPKAKVAYDILAQRGGAKLYSQLVWLFEAVKDSDGAPTQGMREVYGDQHQGLEKEEAAFKGLLDGTLAKLNDQARKLDVPIVIVPRAPV